jgi:autotransporter translocation and assembly factor TamB
VSTEFTVNDDLLTFGRINVVSNRLQVFGSGTIALNDARDANLNFNVRESSLDPYIRAWNPRLSPFTTATVSGTLRVRGELSNLDNVLAEATVDRLDVRLFDFPVRNPDDAKQPGSRRPIRLAFDRNIFRVADMQLEGQDTDLNIAGTVDLHNEQIAMRLNGGANLRVLEGFTRNVRSAGRANVDAELSGPMRNPLLSGNMKIADGRLRHFSLPHGLDRINGEVTFDSNGLNLEGVSAELGGSA